MLFSSITFLYYFLPAVLVIYYLTPAKGKNLILFLASFVFYLWGEPKYSVLLLFSVTAGYMGGRCIEYQRQRKEAAFFIAITLGLLVFFKYMDFLMESVNMIFGTHAPMMQIALPIGISFYTFQIISYYVDIYRGEVQAERNFIDFAAYVTMFPQLIAGPIVRFQTVQAELKHRKITWENIGNGAACFVCGLCKKVLIADSLGMLVAELEKIAGIGTVGYWVLAITFMLQLYYDFSGYSDMAIGLGRMLGFTFPENFQYPFISKSISEFWRRWHMTLGGWFRDYLYIPLGGNRVGVPRWCLNMFIVWLFSGLWHGAGWNFALWGLYFGVFLSAEKLLGKQIGKRTGKKIAGSHLYVLLVVLFSFVIFRVESISGIKEQFLGLFGYYGSAMTPLAAYEMKSYLFLLLIACVGATPVVKNGVQKFQNTVVWKKAGWLLQSSCILIGLILATAFLLGSSVHPFLYFRF